MTLFNLGYFRMAALVVNIYHKRLTFTSIFPYVSSGYWTFDHLYTYNKSVRLGEGSWGILIIR